MDNYICVRCGVRYAATVRPPAHCDSYVTFMYSYVNYIPPSGPAVRRIVDRVNPFRYDRIYGCFAGWVVASDAQATVSCSAARYLRGIGDA